MQFLDDSLGEVGAFGQLVLHLLVNLKLLPELHYLSL